MAASTARIDSEVDVLIIGAGPAGLMCANALAHAGVQVRVVDQRPKKVAAGQADGIQPRTIEVLQSYGLAERLIREGNQMHMAAFYNPSPKGGIERIDRAPDVTAPTARFPFEITLHQGAIEAIFLDSLRTKGVEIDRPIQPTAIELSTNEEELKDPHSHPIKVDLKRLDAEPGHNDTETVRAKYVLGADGAHSWVRKTLGITMDGEQTEYIWGVVDTIPVTNFPDIRNRCAIHSNNGSCMVIPREGDMVRLYLQLAEKDVVTDGRVDKSKISPEKLMAVAKKSLYPYEITFPNQIDWWTIYIIGQRVASKFSVHERIFIAGDACHTHSPKAGQGMNASMNDTHNLAWKLTHVLRGWASPDLLKTYEFERRKYAQDLIAFDKEFSRLFSGKPRTEENQDGVSHEQFLQAFQTFGGFTSGIGIHYAPSVLTNTTHETVATNLTVGMRMPPQVVVRAADARPYELQDLLPADTRYKVLIFAGDITEEGQRTKVQALEKEMGRPEGFLKKYTPDGAPRDAIFDVLSICVGKKETINFTDVPELFRTHWSKVLVDDVEIKGINGGKAYESYGILKDGALVIVRPDGYIGMVAPLDKVSDVDTYFKGILKAAR
ncbi:hypothetical protein BD410DRAFT_825808 [Rickenella mellea]|uniref:FAD binding domain-containing protein n=1 Tax=Rickenella mellea TaxID=50990 RepID=A0A4Y7QIP1_9AGAM|nr:hypothetical protein BD410DRAFT_825808 [Rickenella mellea]